MKIKRYDPETDSSETFQGMNECLDGDYVLYSDVLKYLESLTVDGSPKIKRKQEDLGGLKSVSKKERIEYLENNLIDLARRYGIGRIGKERYDILRKDVKQAISELKNGR